MPQQNYFYKEIRVLKIFGISLTGGESVLYKVYSILLIGIANIAYPILAWRDVFIHDFNVASRMMIYQSSTTVSIVKTAVVLYNRMRIGKLLKQLEEEVFLPNVQRGGENEETMIKECLFITNLQTITYWICAVVAVIADELFSLIIRLKSDDYNDWVFPYGPFTVLNVTRSPNFEISLFYQCFSVVCISAHFTTIDLTTAAVLAHLTYQFRILQNSLRQLVKNSHKEMIADSNFDNETPSSANLKIDPAIIPWKYLKRSLVRVVNYHLAIIKIAKEMEDVFSNLLLLVFLGTLGMFCFLVYNVSVSTLSIAMVIRSMLEMGAVCMQVLTICYWGEQIKAESERVKEAVYEADVVGTDLKFQKGLLMIIKRSHVPIKLTAGSFADIGLPTFVWILRSSYSAFMVLRNNDLKM